jgi:hypothetical protein
LARKRDGNYFVHTTLIAIFLIAYAVFLLLFASSSILAAGSAVFQVIGTAFPAYWTFQAYKSSCTALRLPKRRQRCRAADNKSRHRDVRSKKEPLKALVIL